MNYHTNQSRIDRNATLCRVWSRHRQVTADRKDEKQNKDEDNNDDKGDIENYDIDTDTAPNVIFDEIRSTIISAELKRQQMLIQNALMNKEKNINRIRQDVKSIEPKWWDENDIVKEDTVYTAKCHSIVSDDLRFDTVNGFQVSNRMDIRQSINKGNGDKLTYTDERKIVHTYIYCTNIFFLYM